MRWYLKIGIAFFLSLLFVPITLGQETLNLGPETLEEEAVLQAVIRSAEQVEVGRNIIFDGSESINPLEDSELDFSWDFDDGSRVEKGGEVVHTFENAGTYTVRLTVNNGEETAESEQTVFVYERLLFLFTYDIDPEKIADAYEYAAQKNILLKVLNDESSVSDLEATKVLAQNLSENKKDLAKTDLILIWTRTANIGLNALSDFAKSEKGASEQLSVIQKTFAIITEENLTTLSRIAKGTYAALAPERIILLRPEALFTMIESPSSLELIGNLYNQGYEFESIDKNTVGVSLWNIMSTLVNYLRNNGVSSEVLFLILMLPVIATLIAIARQILGVTTMGIYIPTIFTLAFFSLGFLNSIILILLVWGTGTLTRLFFKRYRLMYVPRIAIIITITSVNFLFVMALSSLVSLNSFLQISIIPALIMIALVEQILSVQVERGLRASTLLIMETVVVSAISYFLIMLPSFQNLILAYPEFIVVLIVINVIVGKWTGLRLSELFRFRRLLDEVEHAEE